MGLETPALRFIAHQHNRKPFTGPVLTLGRQAVWATLDEVQQLLVQERIDPAALLPDLDTRTNIPSWFGTPNEKNTSDAVFFKLLGVSEIWALDYSAYEHAEIMADLNLPVDRDLHNRFNLVVDGGTLEHVFDVRQALMNIALMLKPGGRIIHILPADGCLNHGFYQFGPTLFFDYYSANAFTDLKGFLRPLHSTPQDTQPWDLWEVTGPSRIQPLTWRPQILPKSQSKRVWLKRMVPKRIREFIRRFCPDTSNDFIAPVQLYSFFVAEKTATSTADQNPIQEICKLSFKTA